MDLLNCMAMLPNADTAFEHIEEPSKEMRSASATRPSSFAEMRHCTRCRADAVGLLDNDKPRSFAVASALRQLPKPEETAAPMSRLRPWRECWSTSIGEASRFQIWGEDSEGGYKLFEERTAPPAGGGAQRWHNISRLLADCRAILVNDLGDSPKEILKKKGIQPAISWPPIERGLEAVYTGRGLNQLQGRMRKCSSKGACAGGGNGCG